MSIDNIVQEVFSSKTQEAFVVPTWKARKLPLAGGGVLQIYNAGIDRDSPPGQEARSILGIDIGSSSIGKVQVAIRLGISTEELVRLEKSDPEAYRDRMSKIRAHLDMIQGHLIPEIQGLVNQWDQGLQRILSKYGKVEPA